jgi:hypothetical protein
VLFDWDDYTPIDKESGVRRLAELSRMILQNPPVDAQ